MHVMLQQHRLDGPCRHMSICLVCISYCICCILTDTATLVQPAWLLLLCMLLHCYFGLLCRQALQYKTQATQAQLKAQQEAEARKRIEAEAARAVAARMTEKPRVSKSVAYSAPFYVDRNDMLIPYGTLSLQNHTDVVHAM